MSETEQSSCGDDCGCHTLPRRDFLKLGGAAATGLVLGVIPATAASISRKFPLPAPQEKGLSPEWLKANLTRGNREIYTGGDLRYIGMPVGGICAGEVLVGGDGQLWLWDIFNRIKFGLVDKTVTYAGQSISAGGGANYVESPEQVHPFLQGFALETGSGSESTIRRMNASGWKDIHFSGEYPIGFNSYRDPDCLIDVELETFSPYIPLESESSGHPAVIQRFRLKNSSSQTVRCRFGGWIENAVLKNTIGAGDGQRENAFVRDHQVAAIDCNFKVAAKSTLQRPDSLFENFEKPTYEGWTVTGMAFGPGPIEISKMPSYQGQIGGHGSRVACSFNSRNGESIEVGDNYTGKLTSRPFTIDRLFIAFLIGGGNHPGTCCINLLIDSKVVRTATGKDQELLELGRFNVAEFAGHTAQLEIVDDQGGAWGHITIDDIVFTDVDPVAAAVISRGDYGSMSLSLLSPSHRVEWAHHLSEDDPASGLFGNPKEHRHEAIEEAPGRLVSGLWESLVLKPGEERIFTLAWTWHFPNLSLNRIGAVQNHYSTRAQSSLEVARQLDEHFETLYSTTKQWHATWYDSTLPYWLLDRVMGNNATLATMTCVRFGNGRFYGWEGIGCCDGTCGHVWAYAQGPARLFPDLERSVREMVDFDIAFHQETGIIDFRGEYGEGYATDAQGGYVLRAYREHQMSKDSSFLTKVYPRAKKALQYLIEQDSNADGIIENWQHNTLDVDLIGASSWLSSIYVSALRAGQQMASEMGDEGFASECLKIAEAGIKNISDRLWNGEYFIQVLDYSKNPDALRYGDGCEVDQVMGQWWSWQLGLDRVVEAEKTKAALKALYKYNFYTDIGPYREKEKPGRWYAVPGEAGLIMCTFPKGDREKVLGNKPVWASGYFNECMTGFEYEAAAHMVSEGLVEEGMAVTRAVHDRYHPSKRNPWNEVECSDHYARCMAVHSVYIAACGYEYHGPNGHIGFAPRISPENFKAAFNAAEGWGTFDQKIEGNRLVAKLTPVYGSLTIKTFSLESLASNTTCTASLAGTSLNAKISSEGPRRLITFDQPVTVKRGESLVVTLA